MKIGVNARFLAKPYTGIGKHTIELFSVLSNQNPDDELILVTAEKVPHEIAEKFAKNAEIVLLPELFPGSAGIKKTAWEQIQLPRYFQKRKVDLVHIPYPANFWFGFEKPVLVTVHDTIPWSFEAYCQNFLSRLYQKMALRSIQKADHILTVSEASLHEIVNNFGVPRDKISISSNAVADSFGEKVDEGTKKNVLKKYGIPFEQPFFLYLGGYDERKNVRTLLNVYLTMIAPRYKCNLVLGGGKILNGKLYKSYDEAETVLENKGMSLQGKIIKTGFIEEKDLPALYQAAYAFITPSFQEGCNLPLLEAIASGTPTIASDLPVHHEMVGEAAEYCSPLDEMMLAKLMENLLLDNAFYQTSKKKVLALKIPFSWSKTAQDVAKIYQNFLL